MGNYRFLASLLMNEHGIPGNRCRRRRSLLALVELAIRYDNSRVVATIYILVSANRARRRSPWSRVAIDENAYVRRG